MATTFKWMRYLACTRNSICTGGDAHLVRQLLEGAASGLDERSASHVVYRVQGTDGPTNDMCFLLSVEEASDSEFLSDIFHKLANAKFLATLPCVDSRGSFAGCIGEEKSGVVFCRWVAVPEDFLVKHVEDGIYTVREDRRINVLDVLT